MTHEIFSERANKILSIANQESQRLGHECVDPEHLLLGILKEDTGIGATALKNLGVDFQQIRQETERLIGKTACMAAGQLPLAPRTNKILEFAVQEAKDIKRDCVGTEHLLLGLLRERDGIVFNILKQAKVEYVDAQREVLKLLGLTVEAEMPVTASAPDRNQKNKSVAQQMQEIQIRRLELAQAILEQEQELLTVIRKRTDLERELTAVVQRRLELEQRLSVLMEEAMEIEKNAD
jgi:ATP-dependent Clp protease ATP-binding subunit ClpC